MVEGVGGEGSGHGIDCGLVAAGVDDAGRTVQLHLAQAHSNKARRGRKSDFRDAERLAHRFVADELILSFVPDQEQRGWRMLARSRYRLVRERGRIQNHIEGLLEDAQLKLSSVISDLFGASGRRILEALAETDGESIDTERLAALGDEQLRAARKSGKMR